LVAEASTAQGEYDTYLKTNQIAPLTTKVVILQGNITNGSGFDWWNNEAPGSYVTESSLGGLEIKAV
jgi:hypothetical protein